DLGAFARRHGQIKIDLHERLSPEVLQAVRDGAADLGLCQKSPADGLPGLQSRPYRSDRLLLVIPHGHALAGRASVRFDEVLDCDIVGLHAGSSISLAMRTAAAQVG